MGLYGGLSEAQRDLRDRVCAAASTLEGRLRALGQQAWRGVDSTDVEAVRGWLFDLHHTDVRHCEG